MGADPGFPVREQQGVPMSNADAFQRKHATRKHSDESQPPDLG